MDEKLRLKNEILLAPIRLALYLGIYALFFLIFGISHFQMLTLSRTLAVTLFTFTIMLILMINVYGGYDIGKRKSKPVISSLILATLITDIITYFSFQIMNVNENKYKYFTFFNRDFIYLMVIVFLQITYIYLMVRFGNKLYFYLYPPQRSCIIAKNQSEVNKIISKTNKLKLQFKVEEAINYQYSKIYKKIKCFDTVFFGDIPGTERTELLNFCYENNKNIYLAAQLDDIVISYGNQVIVDDMSFIFIPYRQMTIFQRTFKRILDIFFSLMLLIILSPLFLIISITILLEDGTPIIFTQKRMTKDKKSFKIYKFRTMKKEVCSASYGAIPVIKDDKRITSAGRILRRYRLDELPQIWNILQGNMSFVGPRPEMLENANKYLEKLPTFSYRYRMKAGLTGYAQIEGKYNTTAKDKLMLDMMYLQNYSIANDFKIILRTAIVFFKKDSTEGFKSKEKSTLQLKIIND